MMSFGADLRTAARSLIRTPAMAACAILCLALGVGGTTAVASAIGRALLQRLPLRDADRLVAVHRITPQTGPQGEWPESPANYNDLAHETRTIDGLSALTFGTSLVDVGGETVQASRIDVTGGLFGMLGAKAQLGRFIAPDDDQLSAPATAVLSDAFWRTKLHAKPDIVGRTLDIDGKPTTIVGIAPTDFHIPHGSRVLQADLWTPIRFTPQRLALRGNNSLLMLGRLAPGASVTSAESEMRSLFARLIGQYPELRSENLRVAPLLAESERSVRTPLLLLMGAVAMVLLIAATNVAALLLARGVQKRREMAVCSALGAGAWRLMSRAFVESLIIATLGMAGGLALAALGVKTIGALASQRIPQLAGLSIDARVIGFGVAVSLIVSVACAIVPAWRGARVDPQDALRGGRGGGTGRDQHRLLRGLVVFEVALSLVLLIGAGLMLRAFEGLLAKTPGFETAHVLTANVTVASARYAEGTSVRRFLEPALRAIQAIPGVESAGSINLVPYVNWGWNSNVRYEGVSGGDPTRLPLVEERTASPGFFSVTDQRLVAGRLLGPGDDDSPKSAPVVVVNQALAKRDFHGANPVGRRFYTGDTSFATIVGVVTDIRNVGPFKDPAPEMYWTFRQASSGASQFPIMIRTRGEPTSVVAAVRAAIRGIDPTAAVSDVAPMQDVIGKSLGQPRFYLSMLAAFAAVALLLTIAGVYGVLSYVVAQRSRELGVRVALGSSRARLVSLVTGDGAVLAIIGATLGLFGSFALTRFMASILYGVSPVDVVTWAIAAMGLLLTTILASAIPALRASRADPVVAMRLE